ncbi:acyl-coenzyme A thioesterase PaaI-like protein [Prauserella isguenensis]|uniref:Acyl-coenzyme A thioesterase PaaI-like protein n=1 Tax=Prauserella isguenensis TaxID=1470180 RepID=A0A839S381_9PSEU|nr:thioesterase family protein [Prauserella isguenensis]MBB3052185.1 acyl-coenzyme A thioesterase PaaI-like protein [Prauserella isguenensis]
MTTTAWSEFDTDTAVTASGDGHYSTTVSDRWAIREGVANGGYLLALCVRALGDQMAMPDPLVVSAHFVRPGTPGPAEIATEVVKQGRRTATGCARLSQQGGAVLLAQATYADLEGVSAPAAGNGPVAPHDSVAPPESVAFTNTAPALAGPETCTDPLTLSEQPGATVAARIEYRLDRVPGFWYGTPSGEPISEFWMRFADGRDADTTALAMLVDAAAPVALDLGVGGSSTIELTVHVRARPAPGWLACRAFTKHLSGGHHEEDFEIWDSRGVLVAQSRQLALVR